MSLKFLYLLPCALLLIGVSQAKDVASPCSNGGDLCALIPDALKDKTLPTMLKFERVVDGDTFVAGGRKIRIWGIDAPEKGDGAYRVSGWLLQSLVEGKELGCKLIDQDKYRRDVMQCFTDGQDIGAVMVKFGMAKDYKRYSAGYYRQEEKEAKEKGRGIWEDSSSKK